MINFPKFKTIDDVFTHNFEALRRWRAFISVPHLMPDAARYYVAQHLDEQGVIAGLWVEQPEHQNAVALAFPDKSVLVWPDWIFENEETYHKALDCAGDLEELDEIWEEIKNLAGPGHADELFARAVEFLVFFACFVRSTGAQNVLGPYVRGLVSHYNALLARAFRDAGKQRKHACDWLQMVTRAQEIGFELQLSTEASATLLQTPKPQRRGRLAHFPHPRWTKARIIGAYPSFKIKVIFYKDRHVQRSDFPILTQKFNPKTMSAASLRQSCDAVQILFCGYQHDSRPPMVIPEARTFLRGLHRAWPYAPFFCDLHGDFLQIEAFAHLDHFTVLEKSASAVLRFIICPAELRRYVQQAHKTIRMLGTRAVMTPAQVRRRILRFDKYIGQRVGSFRKVQ